MRHKLLLVIIFFCIKAYSQTDTIYVYEDIIVYDTIYVYDTVVERTNWETLSKIEPITLQLLIVDNLYKKASLMLLYKGQSATIPINGIILNEDIKEMESMRKLSFFGVMKFAFNSMVLAQSDYGISVGAGTWWANCNNPSMYGSVSSASYAPTSGINIYLKQTLQNKFTFETSLGYKLLLRNKSYEVSCANPDEHNTNSNHYCLNMAVPNIPKLPLDASDISQFHIGEEASATNYHLINIPISIGYTLYKFTPYIGISYSFKMYNSNKSELIYDENNDQTSLVTYERKGLNTFKHNLGFIAGVNYLINSKWSVGLNYYHGLTADYQINVNNYDYKNENIASVDKYKWISRNLELSVAYSLRKASKLQL